MEIEVSLDDGEDYSKAKDEIFKLFEKLGITEGFERTSYMELLCEIKCILYVIAVCVVSKP